MPRCLCIPYRPAKLDKRGYLVGFERAEHQPWCPAATKRDPERASGRERKARPKRKEKR